MKTAVSVSFIIIFTTFVNFNLSAQGEAALPFLTYPVSPVDAAMGNIGASLPSNDAYGFWDNPAQLGHTSQNTDLAFQFYPEETKIYDLVSYNSFALNAGYNFNKLINFPLSVGFGYGRKTFFYNQTDKDACDAYSIGAGVDYFVEFGIGYTYKNINSDLGNYSAKISAYDIGLLLNVPITRLILDKIDLNFVEGIQLIPELNFSVGYTQSNIGDKIYYVDPAQSDPLPRTARLGYSFSGGFKEESMKYPLDVLNFAFTVDAEDYLINRDSTGASSYQSSFGDINIGKNVLGIKGDGKVYAHAGYKIGLLETVELMRGHFGSSSIIFTTNGYGIKTKGLFKILADNSNVPALNFLAQHVDIRYYSSTYLIDFPAETSFKGLELELTNFNFN